MSNETKTSHGPGQGLDSSRREPFFQVFACSNLAFVILSFGGNALLTPEALPPITYLHHLHGGSMLLWFLLCAVQPWLIRRFGVAAHRKLGAVSVLLVVSLLVFAFLVMQSSWARTENHLLATSNVVNLSLFVSFYASAIARRKHALAHKRSMAYASVCLIGPGAGRVTDMLDLPILWSVPLVLVFQLAPLAYDAWARREVHRTTALCCTLVVASIPLTLFLGGSSWWVDMLGEILGTRHH